MNSSSMWATLKRFDAYAKPMDDFRIRTRTGGVLTVASALVMLLLFASEIRDYLKPEMKEELFVDTSRTGKLKINLDITFQKISCDFLGLDAMDVSGEQHIDIEHNIYKRRLDLQGHPIEDAQKEVNVGAIAKVATNNGTSSGNATCGSCYGAETEEKKCCNTCNDVRDAYRLKTWKFDPRGIEQCRDGLSSELEERALKEGCQIYGYLEVNRVGGSFHVAPGKSFIINHIHVHDVNPFASTDFNVSHTINHLSFGLQREQDGQDSQHPLDGVEGMADRGAMMFQYYIKIVPTAYVLTDGNVFPSNQFSVTRHSKVVSVVGGESGMPGVFFSYEMSPVMVKYSLKDKSVGHFLTGLCAIIGGVFTVAGILDKLIYTSSRLIAEKTDLGKAT